MSWTGQAVLFDLDGVLVDSIAAVERTWLRWADRHGLDAQSVLRTVHDGPARENVAKLAPALDAEAEAEAIDGEQAEDTEGVIAAEELTRAHMTAGDLGAARLLSNDPPRLELSG